MAMVKVVLVLLAAGCFYLAYTYISVLPSERAKARRFRSLEEAGIETQARLVSLSPYPGDARGLAVLELVTPAGETIRAK
ncbi:hypothetical protein [Streptomyces rochei]|uniref:hypothetical protein n=1 Tax=Streptomyces rochei TaxID=1928 RepID=UPI0036AE315B